MTLTGVNSTFPSPIKSFDIHVYFNEKNPDEVHNAEQVFIGVKKNFPEIEILDIEYAPAGVYLFGMFEIHIYSPEELGKILPWLILNRNGTSILLHPHTPDLIKDHTELTGWFGNPVEINIEYLNKIIKDREVEQL